MTVKATRGTGSVPVQEATPRVDEESTDAQQQDLLRAPQGELRRFARVNPPATKRLPAAARPVFTRGW